MIFWWQYVVIFIAAFTGSALGRLTIERRRRDTRCGAYHPVHCDVRCTLGRGHEDLHADELPVSGGGLRW